MLHVITLFTVPDHEDAFVRSLRMNSDWQTLARLMAPDLIAADLLGHQLSPLYVCHDFWTTPEAHFRGLHSPTVEIRVVSVTACSLATDSRRRLDLTKGPTQASQHDYLFLLRSFQNITHANRG